MSPLKTYTVPMIVSEVWDIDVEAASPEEAKARAAAAKSGDGYNAFSFRYDEVDGFEIVDEREAAQ
jgi:hypothetical protein